MDKRSGEKQAQQTSHTGAWRIKTATNRACFQGLVVIRNLAAQPHKDSSDYKILVGCAVFEILLVHKAKEDIAELYWFDQTGRLPLSIAVLWKCFPISTSTFLTAAQNMELWQIQTTRGTILFRNS